jgi:hypothetical protein
MPNVLSKGISSRKVLQKLLHYRKNSIEEIINENNNINNNINSKNYSNLSGINSSSTLPVPPPVLEDDENENYDFDFEYASAPRGLIDTLIM